MDADRRALLKAGLVLGLAPAQNDPASSRPRAGDLLVRSDDSSRTPLSPDDIPFTAMQIVAWAMDPSDRTVRSGSRLNRLILLRFDGAKLAPATRSRSSDGVAADT